MYTLETIKKYHKLMNDRINHYMNMPLENIRACISGGNRKIGRVLNISLPPVKTCANCAGCMHYCYDIKANMQYPNTVIDARARNYAILKRDRDLYFSLIDAKMSKRRTNKFFRFHVAGDILDADYFHRMVEIARKHSNFIIWTYTKNYAVVNTYCDKYGLDAIPENLHVMYSEWDGMQLVNPYNFPVFTCKMKNGNINHPDAKYFDNLYKCPGNCDVCKELRAGCIAGMNTYCDEH